MHAKVKPQTKLHLFGAASCHGAQDKRCDIAPDLLKGSNLVQKLADRGVTAQWQNIFRVENSDDRRSLVAMLQSLASAVADSVNSKTHFTVIGGDHSSAIGTWSGAAKALRNHGELGLIWVDAHVDAHTPQTSISGALHGMPVACLLGQGAPDLLDIGFAGGKLKPENICLVGVRSFEAPELKLLAKMGVKVFYMEDIRQRGLDAVMNSAVELASKNSAGFGISIDMDVFDPVDAPGVGTPAHGGLLASQFLPACARLMQATKFIGAEIVEFNPFRDRNHKTELLIKELITTLFN